MRTASFGKLLAIAAFALTVAVAPSCMSDPGRHAGGHAAAAAVRRRRDVGAEARLDRAARGSAHPARAESAAPRHPAGHGTLPALVPRRPPICCADRRQRGARAPPGRAGGRTRGPVRGGCRSWPSASRTRSPRCGRWRPSRMGLIGDPAARGALLEALGSSDPLLQGRAAEALGLIGDKADAPAVGAMVRAHVAAGALRPSRPTTSTIRCRRQIEATRLGLYALARLGQLRRPGGRGGGRTRSAGVSLVAGGLRAAAGGRPPRGAGR